MGTSTAYPTPRSRKGILETTWQAKPAANAVPVGTRFLFANVGIGGSLWMSDGTDWQLTAPAVLDVVSTKLAVNTGTAEAVLKNWLIFGGLLGKNRTLQLSGIYSYTDTATAKIFRTRAGATVTGLAGTIMRASTRSSSGSTRDVLTETISARGSESSQIGGISWSLTVQGTGVTPTSAIDTSADWYYASTFQPPADGVEGAIEHARLMLI